MDKLPAWPIIRRTLVDTTLHVHAPTKAEAMRIVREGRHFPIRTQPFLGATDSDDDVILRETYRYGDHDHG